MISIDLDCYCACRIALAMAMLAEPGNPKHRTAFNALHAALNSESAREIDSTREMIAKSRAPVLLRQQAG